MESLSTRPTSASWRRRIAAMFGLIPGTPKPSLTKREAKLKCWRILGYARDQAHLWVINDNWHDLWERFVMFEHMVRALWRM